MQTSVTFKNIEPAEHLAAYVSNKLNRFDKYLDNVAEASVVLSIEKFRHIAEINIIADRLTVNGKEETADMYSAIDMVLDKIEKQIKKSRGKVRKRRTTRAKTRELGDDVMDPFVDEEGREIKVTNIEYKPMDVEEAVLQMDLIEDTFLVFTNARTEMVNVLYRTKDGGYGLIQPRS